MVFALFVYKMLKFKNVKLQKGIKCLLSEHFLFAKFLTNSQHITILE